VRRRVWEEGRGKEGAEKGTGRKGMGSLQQYGVNDWGGGVQ